MSDRDGKSVFKSKVEPDYCHATQEVEDDICILPDSASSHNNSVATHMHIIDPARNRYPFCIVWSPLPPITWFLPFIGHTGICDSEGIIWDFAGPYTIGKERMAFGTPTRYIPLNPSLARSCSWDIAVTTANREYSKRMHNLFCDNCHSHVAYALNTMG